jgi:hypothetical protein
MPRDEKSLYGPVPVGEQLEAWQRILREKSPKVFAKTEFGKTEEVLGKLGRLPSEADGLVLVPKDEIIKEFYGLALRKENKRYCRGVRLFQKWLKEYLGKSSREVQNCLVGNPTKRKLNAQEIDRLLYKFLLPTKRSLDCLNWFDEHQPGPFMVIPISIDAETKVSTPKAEHEKILPDQFLLPTSVIQCWILMRTTMEKVDLRTNLDALIPSDRFQVDCLGDTHYIWNGGNIVEHGTPVFRLVFGALRLDEWQMDVRGDLRIAKGYLPAAK